MGSYGLNEITLKDKPVFDQFFRSCNSTLSDYTFANTFIWRDSIHLRWQAYEDMLCVFANGDGRLTMLFPPMGRGDFGGSLRRALDVCERYNFAHGYDKPSCIEYISSAMAGRFGAGFVTRPMSGDYVYSTKKMIDLDGGDLASKRHSRNRFKRLYVVRTEDYEDRHFGLCLGLLEKWTQQAEDSACGCESPSCRVKRAKEHNAVISAMKNHAALGLKGMVLFADGALAGFTFGEWLGCDTCSILIEKTDRQFNGAAQFIFSEFCRQHWSETTWCNVGDDWEIPSLAWTKQSYRPAARLEKFTAWPVVEMPAAVPCAPAVQPARVLVPVGGT